MKNLQKLTITAAVLTGCGNEDGLIVPPSEPIETTSVVDDRPEAEVPKTPIDLHDARLRVDVILGASAYRDVALPVREGALWLSDGDAGVMYLRGALTTQKVAFGLDRPYEVHPRSLGISSVEITLDGDLHGRDGLYEGVIDLEGHFWLEGSERPSRAFQVGLRASVRDLEGYREFRAEAASPILVADAWLSVERPRLAVAWMTP